MLAAAGVSNSYGGFQAKPLHNSAGVIHITVVGLMLISIYCFVSGLSGVYTEYILKRHYQVICTQIMVMLYSNAITR